MAGEKKAMWVLFKMDNMPTSLDPGPILCKETVTQAENSWVTE